MTRSSTKVLAVVAFTFSLSILAVSCKSGSSKDPVPAGDTPVTESTPKSATAGENPAEKTEQPAEKPAEKPAVKSVEPVKPEEGNETSQVVAKPETTPKEVSPSTPTPATLPKSSDTTPNTPPSPPKTETVKPTTPPTPPTPTTPSRTPAIPGFQETVVLNTERGPIGIHLYEKECPGHCENFRSLVKSGYFNGVSFHRVCYGFVQAGDPTGSGLGGIAQTIPAEIKRPHLRGALVASPRIARDNPNNESHGSQFFIMKRYYPAFNGKYTVFGRVVRGMREVVDQIPDGEKLNNYLVPKGEGVKIISATLVTPMETGAVPVRKPPVGTPKTPVSTTPVTSK